MDANTKDDDGEEGRSYFVMMGELVGNQVVYRLHRMNSEHEVDMATGAEFARFPVGVLDSELRGDIEELMGRIAEDLGTRFLEEALGFTVTEAKAYPLSDFIRKGTKPN